MPAYGKAAIEQAIINYRKVARNAIRLRHSIAADNELNEVMPAIERWLVAQAQQGYVPAATYGQVEALLDGMGK